MNKEIMVMYHLRFRSSFHIWDDLHVLLYLLSSIYWEGVMGLSGNDLCGEFMLRKNISPKSYVI